MKARPKSGSSDIAEVPAHALPNPRAQSAESLVRLLVAKANEADSGLVSSEGVVILKTEVDGVTCVLTRPSSRPPATAPTLSPREREIARLVAKGYQDKVIAAVLDISKHTVGTHLRRMYQKLEVPSRAALIAKVMSDGLLS